MISPERLQAALTYLAETDAACAELRAQVSRKEYICKKVRARCFLAADGNNEERKATAEVSHETDEAEKEKTDAIVEYEKVRAKRETEGLIVDVWRSLNANRRQGSFT